MTSVFSAFSNSPAQNPFQFQQWDINNTKPSRFNSANTIKPTTKTHESKEHLIQRLQTNHLIQTADNNVLKESMGKILQLFTLKQILFTITKHTNMNNLQSIHQIIKKQIKLKCEQSNDESVHNNSNDINNENKMSLISVGSQSIGYICDFLNQNDINVFKLTSREISIICLQQTFKIPLSIINANNLKHKNLKFIKRNSLISETRHSPQKQYYSLFEDWEKEYKIPLQNQLLFKLNKSWRNETGISNATLIDPRSIRLNTISGNKYYSFLLCDNRKFIVFDNGKSFRKFNIETDTFEYLIDYKLMILGYDNIKTDETNIAQFILHKRGAVTYKHILSYIENSFIKLDTMNNSWYNQLQCDLKLKSLTNNENVSSIGNLLIRGMNTVRDCNFYFFQIYVHQLTGLQKIMKERKVKWMRVYRQRLGRIYSKYQPSKMDNVEIFMNKYGKNESDSDRIHQLYEKICHKYGLVPCDKYTANGNQDEPDQIETQLF